MIEELNIPEEHREEFVLWDVEIHDYTGSNNQTCYEHFFYVPDEASKDILNDMGWTKNQCVYLSTDIYD